MPYSYTPIGPFVNDQSPEIDDVFLNALEAWAVQVPVTSPTVNSLATDTTVSSDGSGNATLATLSAHAFAVSPTANQITGATSGTATLYQTDTGTIIRVYVFLSNFWNNGGTTQTIALPQPFAANVAIRTQACYQVELQVASAAQTLSILTALSVSGGTASNQAYICGWSLGGCNAPIDTIGFRSGDSAGRTGIIILEGY